MEKDFWLSSLFLVFGLFLGTGQTNGYRDREEDLYFPQYYRKAGKLHRILFKDQKYLRFSVYWTQKLIWFNFTCYSIFLFIGSMTKYGISDERMYNKLALILLFVMGFSTSIVDILIWIYVRIMRNK